MPALLAIILTASRIGVAADSVPKFDVERTCRPVATMAALPGRDAPACRGDEQDARNKLKIAGATTAEKTEAVAPVLSGSVALQVTWNCSHAWKWRRKPRSSGENLRPGPLAAIDLLLVGIVFKKAYIWKGR